MEPLQNCPRPKAPNMVPVSQKSQTPLSVDHISSVRPACYSRHSPTPATFTSETSSHRLTKGYPLVFLSLVLTAYSMVGWEGDKLSLLSGQSEISLLYHTPFQQVVSSLPEGPVPPGCCLTPWATSFVGKGFPTDALLPTTLLE